jgi:dephospho-CoA kinase
MLKIGITGGIGSGKTTVAKVFEILGIPVFYADQVAKTLMHTDKLLIEALKEAFGDQVYSNGELNRTYLAAIVFDDERKLLTLNQLVHPAVLRAFNNWAAVQQNTPYVLKEAALLFESGSYKLCDKTILVVAPRELKIQRVMERDMIPEEHVLARMNKQFTEDQARLLADFVVINDQTQLLIPQVLHLHEQFLSLAGK